MRARHTQCPSGWPYATIIHAPDVSEPAQASLSQQSEHARDSCLLQNCHVRNAVLPCDDQNPSEAAHRHCQCSAICEEHLSDQHLAYVGLGTKPCEIEEVSVGSGVEVDAIFGLAEGVGQQQIAKVAENCWRKYTSLLHPAFDLKKVRMKNRWSELCLACCQGRTRSSLGALGDNRFFATE